MKGGHILMTTDFELNLKWINEYEEDYDTFLQKGCKKYGIATDNINYIYLMMITRVSKLKEFSLWHRTSADLTYKFLNEMIGSNLSSEYLKMSELALFQFFNTLVSANDSILFLDKFNGDKALKTSVLTLPKLAQVINGPLTNVFKYFMYIEQINAENNQTGKNPIEQNNLGPMIGSLTKYGFWGANLVDKDIRNAMSHGGYELVGDDRVRFTFTSDHKYQTKVVSASKIKDNLCDLLDDLNGMLVGILRFLIEKSVSVNELANETLAWQEFYNKIKLSTLAFSCDYVGETDVDGLIQMDFTLNSTISEDTILTWCMNATKLARVMYPKAERYMFKIAKPDAVNSWGQITGECIDKLINGQLAIQTLGSKMISGEGQLLFVWYPSNPDNDGSVTLLFDPYSTIVLSDGSKLDYINDCSIEGAKRFNCRLFIDSPSPKKLVKKIAYEGIEKIKGLPNFSKVREISKNGLMDANVVQIDVYLKDKVSRHENAFVKSSNNENYVTSVLYTEDGYSDKTLSIYKTLEWQDLRKQDTHDGYFWLWNKRPKK